MDWHQLSRNVREVGLAMSSRLMGTTYATLWPAPISGHVTLLRTPNARLSVGILHRQNGFQKNLVSELRHAQLATYL